MANNASNVEVATSGQFYFVPDISTITSATTSLPSPVDHGLINEDGPEITPESTSTPINAWNAGGAVRTLKTEAQVKIKITFLEGNDQVKSLYYGSAPVNGKISWDPAKSFRGSFVLDLFDVAYEGGEITLIRYVFPDAEVTAVDAISINGTTALQYGVELTAYKVDGRVADIYEGPAETP